MTVSLFSGKAKDPSLNKLWLKRRGDFQKALTDKLNARSSFQSTSTQSEYGLDSSLDQIISETQSAGGDGALIGEFDGQNLKISIIGTLSEGSLATFGVPIINLNGDINEMASSLANAIMAKFRYTGFIISTHKNEAKINIGRNQGAKVDALYAIYDFVGDAPTFSSPIHKVGELQITRVGDNAALGKITVATMAITPYLKVQLMHQHKQLVTRETKEVKKESQNGFWISAGAEFLSINTVVKNGNPALIQQRMFEVPITAAGALGLGYSRFSLDVLYSNFSNSSNNVTYFEGTGRAQIYSVKTASMILLSSLGFFYSQYGVTPAPNPSALLVATNTYAPLLEERFQWATDIYFSAQLYLPLFSNDSANGGSALTQSFGGGLEAGWRYGLTEKIKFDLGARSHFFSISTQSGAGIQEFEFSLLAHMVYVF